MALPLANVSAFTETLFFDDFTGSTLASHWTPRYDFDAEPKGHTFPGEKAWIADPRYSWNGGYSPFSLANSCLRIRMERVPEAISNQVPEGYDWVSGAVTTRGTFAYGDDVFIEARIKVPPGKGVWPAFWSLVDGAPHREIDFMEFWGSNLGLYTIAQHTGTWPDLVSTNRLLQPSYDLSTGFHRYGLIRSAGVLTGTFDGRVIGYMPEDEGLSGYDPYVILNVAGGGWLGDPDETTPDQNDMLVDWVRVTGL